MSAPSVQVLIRDHSPNVKFLACIENGLFTHVVSIRIVIVRAPDWQRTLTSITSYQLSRRDTLRGYDYWLQACSRCCSACCQHRLQEARERAGTATVEADATPQHQCLPVWCR